jgi:hypothetical protein
MEKVKECWYLFFLEGLVEFSWDLLGPALFFFRRLLFLLQFH